MVWLVFTNINRIQKTVWQLELQFHGVSATEGGKNSETSMQCGHLYSIGLYFCTGAILGWCLGQRGLLPTIVQGAAHQHNKGITEQLHLVLEIEKVRGRREEKVVVEDLHLGCTTCELGVWVLSATGVVLSWEVLGLLIVGGCVSVSVQEACMMFLGFFPSSCLVLGRRGPWSDLVCVLCSPEWLLGPALKMFVTEWPCRAMESSVCV